MQLLHRPTPQLFIHFQQTGIQESKTWILQKGKHSNIPSINVWFSLSHHWKQSKFSLTALQRPLPTCRKTLYWSISSSDSQRSSRSFPIFSLSTRFFSFLFSTTSLVIAFMPFHPADKLSSSPYVTIHTLLVYPFLNCCGNSVSLWDSTLSWEPAQATRIQETASSGAVSGFSTAQNSQRIKWSSLLSVLLWFTETCRIHGSVQNWVWRHSLTYRVFLISDSYNFSSSIFPR